MHRRRVRFYAAPGQWDYRSKVGARNALPYPALRGAFQLGNASAALAALDVLKDRLPVSMEAVRRGLVEVNLAGRFQFVPGKPALILDVAHNPHAARSLAQNLAGLPSCPHTYAIFAMLKDKDMAGVAAALGSTIDTWLVAGIAAPRGATAGELAASAEAGRRARRDLTFDSIAEALSYAYNAAGENDRIIAFGSFYTVAEVMAAKGLSSSRHAQVRSRSPMKREQGMAKAQTEDELNLRRKARRRLIGAVAFTLAVVVILPMVLDSEPKPTGKDIDLRIPSPDKAGEFVPGAAVSGGAGAIPPAASAVVSTPVPLANAVIAAPAQAPDAKKPGAAQFSKQHRARHPPSKPSEPAKPEAAGTRVSLPVRKLLSRRSAHIRIRAPRNRNSTS